METFIQDLHKIGANCKFGTLLEKLIRDRIVAGVTDDTLSEELQSKSDLTLEQAIRLSRQAEERKQSQGILRNSATATVQYVTKKEVKRSTKSEKNKPHTFKTRDGGYTKPTCGYCGKEQHARDKCPARQATWDICGKRPLSQRLSTTKCPQNSRCRP